MSLAAEPLPRTPYPTDRPTSNGHRGLPILPSSTSLMTTTTAEDPMDTTPPASARMAPPSNSSPEMDHDMQTRNGYMENSGNTAGPAENVPTTNGHNSNTLSAAAAATSQQPKVVQTAFIHKLYNMLEDQSIRHLISWSHSNESFVMSPSSDFSKVLSQYFKHTNISSFVRQLNMYGFHKVSDVFHTGAPESALWEFKHGQGNFKRGDLAGLREIKRRASRHALIHRDSFSSSPHKPSVSQPGTPAEPVPEAGAPHMTSVEHSLYDMHARLARTEESNTALSSKCALLSDSLAKCQQWNNDLALVVMKMIPDQESQLFHDVSSMQKDIARHAEMVRSFEDSHDSLLSGRQPYFSNMHIDSHQPLSPRQMAIDERRPSAHAAPPRPSFFRPPPPHVGLSPRRYGSIGNSAHTPTYQPRPSVTIQPPSTPTQHPLASVSEPGGPNLARRHTSADIRDTAGWPPQPPGSGTGGSPFGNQDGSGGPHASGSATPQWPPPDAVPSAADQPVRDMLASYEFGKPRRQTVAEDRTSPPPPHGADGGPPLPHAGAHSLGGAENGAIGSGWGGFGGNSNNAGAGGAAAAAAANPFSGGSANPFSGGGKLAPRFMESAPQTRRSSMASNVHNLLNPSETAERAGEEEEASPGGAREDDRKRKRMM